MKSLYELHTEKIKSFFENKQKRIEMIKASHKIIEDLPAIFKQE